MRNSFSLSKNITVGEELIPDVVIAKSESHRVILNSKGEIEIVSAMGDIQNIGKEIR